MRTGLRIAALALALPALWACDSEQPLQGGSRVATVSLNAVAKLDYYNVPECGASQLVTDAPLPWSYAVEVTVLRKGSVIPEVIATTLADEQRFSSITPYDPLQTPIGGTAVRVSKGSVLYLQTCLGVTDFPVPNFAGRTNPATLDVALNPGDTVIVSARLARASDNLVFQSVYPAPVLQGEIRIDGKPVPLVGPSQSSDEDGAGLTFSYTVN